MSDEGGRRYKPTKAEMDILADAELKYLEDRVCHIISIRGDDVVFEASEDGDHYVSMFTNPDDDGNHYIKRTIKGKEVSLGWFGKCIKKSERFSKTTVPPVYRHGPEWDMHTPINGYKVHKPLEVPLRHD
jgi:hypothetical protein